MADYQSAQKPGVTQHPRISLCTVHTFCKGLHLVKRVHLAEDVGAASVTLRCSGAARLLLRRIAKGGTTPVMAAGEASRPLTDLGMYAGRTLVYFFLLLSFLPISELHRAASEGSSPGG